MQEPAAVVGLQFQLPADGLHVTVDVRPLGQHLKLYLYGGNLEIGDEGIDDIALFPGAAEQEIDRDDLHHLDIAVVPCKDDAVVDFLNGNVLRQRVQRLDLFLLGKEGLELINPAPLEVHLDTASAFERGIFLHCWFAAARPTGEHGFPASHTLGCVL